MAVNHDQNVPRKSAFVQFMLNFKKKAATTLHHVFGFVFSKARENCFQLNKIYYMHVT